MPPSNRTLVVLSNAGGAALGWSWGSDAQGDTADPDRHRPISGDTRPVKRSLITNALLAALGVGVLSHSLGVAPGWSPPAEVAAQPPAGNWGAESDGYTTRVGRSPPAPQGAPQNDVGYATVREAPRTPPPPRPPAPPPYYQSGGYPVPSGPVSGPASGQRSPDALTPPGELPRMAERPRETIARGVPPTAPTTVAPTTTTSAQRPTTWPMPQVLGPDGKPRTPSPSQPEPPAATTRLAQPSSNESRDRATPAPAPVLGSTQSPAAPPNWNQPNTAASAPTGSDRLFPGRVDAASPENRVANAAGSGGERGARPFRPGSVQAFPGVEASSTANRTTQPVPEPPATTPAPPAIAASGQYPSTEAIAAAERYPMTDRTAALDRPPAADPSAGGLLVVSRETPAPANRTPETSRLTEPAPPAEPRPEPRPMVMAGQYPSTTESPTSPPPAAEPDWQRPGAPTARPEPTAPRVAEAPRTQPPAERPEPQVSFWSNDPPQRQAQPAGLPMENWQQFSDYRQRDPQPSGPQLASASREPKATGEIRPLAYRAADLETNLGPGEVVDAQIVARVDNEVVLASEVLPQVELRINVAKERGAPDSVIEQARGQLLQQMLDSLVERKLMYLAAKRGLPPGAMAGVQEQLDKAFADRLDQMIQENGLSDRAALEARMAQTGTSVDAQRQAFQETMLGRHYMQREVTYDETVTRAQLLNYYNENKQDYYNEARARYRELVISFSKVKDRDAAWKQMAELGNRVVLKGERFEDVVREASHGLTASDGGLRNWTTKGSLANKEMDKALFTQPVGQPGPIIETPQGLNILLVTEREEAGYTDFRETQKKIREKIVSKRREAAEARYLENLRKHATIWTILDGDDPHRPQVARENSAPRR